MNKYIEVNALINELHHHFVDGFIEDKWWNSTHVMDAITHTPTADVVERDKYRRLLETASNLEASLRNYQNLAEREVER